MPEKTKRKPNHQTDEDARKHCLFRADELALIVEAMAQAAAIDKVKKYTFSHFVRRATVTKAEQITGKREGLDPKLSDAVATAINESTKAASDEDEEGAHWEELSDSARKISVKLFEKACSAPRFCKDGDDSKEQPLGDQDHRNHQLHAVLQKHN
jgi:hypothetical protein